MRTGMLAIALAAMFSIAVADAAAAQSGFALKASSIFNRDAAETGGGILTPAGAGLGAELVLPGGLGLGVSAYTAGPLDQLHRGASSTLVLGEANYFLPIPLIPIRPYAGIHAGLGSYRRSELSDSPRVKDDLRQLGYQVGLRIRLTSTLGLDTQLRRMSSWLSAEQTERFSREQVLVGLTLF